MACAANLDPPRLKDCLQSQGIGYFSGAMMPDAFLFGDFVLPSSDNCTAFSNLHNFEFATFMALNGDRAYQSFYEGYGLHIAADFAGFWPGGYLGNGGMGANSTSVNWISVWPFMTAVDAFVMDEYLNSIYEGEMPLPGPTVSLGEASFLSQSSISFNKLNPASPVVSPQQVLQCAADWKVVVDQEVRKAYAMSVHPSAPYEFEMTFNDVQNASTFEQAKAHFQASHTCAIQGSAVWLDAQRNPNATVASVTGAVFKWYSESFAGGLCK
jgi:hypothetical protein